MLKTKIMIINDSRTMRFFLEDIIKSYSDCEIMRSHFDGNSALNYLKFKKPDVIILDLEMPNIDGLTFLEMLPNNEKIPTIIVSNYAKDNSGLIMDAMDLGAVDSLAPPSSNTKEEFEKFRNILHHKIIKASLKSSRFSLRTH
jgi:two-component system chemotaxis response regulator CheB